MTINPDTVRKVAGQLDDTHRRALEELDGFYGRGPGHLSGSLGIPLSEARSILRTFREQGIAVLSSLFQEDDGLVAGRGYWLDSFGLAVRKEACGI